MTLLGVLASWVTSAVFSVLGCTHCGSPNPDIFGNWYRIDLLLEEEQEEEEGCVESCGVSSKPPQQRIHGPVPHSHRDPAKG